MDLLGYSDPTAACAHASQFADAKGRSTSGRISRADTSAITEH